MSRSEHPRHRASRRFPFSRRFAGFTVACLAGCLASCGDDNTAGPGPVVATLAVSPASVSVPVGAGVQLSAVARDASGNIISAPSVTWASADSTVATVDGTGLVTGVSVDTTTVVATVGTVTGEGKVTVTAAAPAGLAFTALPAAPVAGSVLTPPVTVEVQDAFGNVVTDFNGPVLVTIGSDPSRSFAPPTATLWGTTTVDAVAGVATFDDLSLDLAASGYTLLAFAQSGTIGGESAAFDMGSALIPISESGTAVRLPTASGSDDGEDLVGAGQLDYHWFGTRYADTGISVGTNGGVILATNVVVNVNPTNASIPSPAPSGFNIVAPFWDDLNATDYGDVWYEETADGFIVLWDGVGFFDSSLSSVGSIQAELIFRTRSVPCSQPGELPCSEIQLVWGALSNPNDPGRATGGGATIGVENGDGSVGWQLGMDTPDMVREGFTVTLGWDETAGNYVRIR